MVAKRPSASAAADVLIVGSLNMDLVIRTPRLPRPGQTVAAPALETIPGGKGANQAVAAARLGGHVAMLGCVGDDAHGFIAARGFNPAKSRILLQLLIASGLRDAAEMQAQFDALG